MIVTKTVERFTINDYDASRNKEAGLWCYDNAGTCNVDWGSDYVNGRPNYVAMYWFANKDMAERFNNEFA